MDKLERAKPNRKRSEFANEGEASTADRALLETPGGEDLARDEAEAALLEQDAGEAPATPRSDITDFRDPGTDNDTPDGLTQDEEAIRRGAEEIPSGRKQPKDMPVFDRGRAPDRR
jgi:hypothetical protein